MVRRFAVIGFVCSVGVSMPADAGQRGLLWRVVQACLANTRLTGAAFPCIAVDIKDGAETGYAVVPVPLQETHVLVVPTVRTIGIEADHLRDSRAPYYFQDAWAARHFVTEGLSRPPGRDDIALAVNSRPGRSQDQLHIHVACLRPDVKASLLHQSGSLHTDRWTRIVARPYAPRYWGRFIPRETLAGVNIFALVADGPAGKPESLDQTTIVVSGAGSGQKPGFIVLARQRVKNSRDEAHGEALLDPSCTAFR